MSKEDEGAASYRPRPMDMPAPAELRARTVFFRAGIVVAVLGCAFGLFAAVAHRVVYPGSSPEIAENSSDIAAMMRTLGPLADRYTYHDDPNIMVSIFGDGQIWITVRRHGIDRKGTGNTLAAALLDMRDGDPDIRAALARPAQETKR